MVLHRPVELARLLGQVSVAEYVFYAEQSSQVFARHEGRLPISEVIHMKGTIREHIELNVFSGLLQHVENDLGELSGYPVLNY